MVEYVVAILFLASLAGQRSRFSINLGGSRSPEGEAEHPQYQGNPKQQVDRQILCASVTRPADLRRSYLADAFDDDS